MQPLLSPWLLLQVLLLKFCPPSPSAFLLPSSPGQTGKRISCVSWLSLGTAEKVWVGALAAHVGCLGLKSTGKEGLKGPLSSQWPHRRD